MIPAASLTQGLRLAPDDKIIDLTPRLRCAGEGGGVDEVGYRPLVSRPLEMLFVCTQTM
jgi:hypothetical protein